METFQAWYFNFDSINIVGGFLECCSASDEFSQLLQITRGYRFEIEPKDLLSTIRNRISEVSKADQSVTVFLDDTEQMRSYIPTALDIGSYVLREGNLKEQVSIYRPILSATPARIKNHEFINICQYLVEPHIMFPELSELNLIDPIESEDETIMPLTESLLVLCKGLDNLVSYTPSFTVI